MRVFIDTNILVSALFFPSPVTDALFDVVLKDEWDAIVCDYVCEELRRVGRDKFGADRAAIDSFLETLPLGLIVGSRNLGAPRMRGDKDMPVLAAAIASGADVLLTGDKDFHELTLTRPRIMTITQFLEEYGR